MSRSSTAGRTGHDRYWCGARDQGDVWFFDKPARNDLHPTMKPVALVERAIRNSSKSRDIVLDPFGGSGSTLIACDKTGRQARLVELDPKYCDVIVQRWQAGRERRRPWRATGGASKKSPPGARPRTTAHGAGRGRHLLTQAHIDQESDRSGRASIRESARPCELTDT